MHEVYDPSIPRTEKPAHWKKLIIAWRKSDLTIKEFCQREQVKAVDFRRWKHRFSKLQKNVSIPCSTQTPGFAPLQLLPVSSPSKDNQEQSIELVINHYRIRIGTSFHEETLLRLMNLLGRIA